MDVRGLATTIDEFNQKNEPFSIGMNFAVAGIGALQKIILEVERGTVSAAEHGPQLDHAEKMLSFGLEQVQRTSRDRVLLAFLHRYRDFIRDLRKRML